jgi:hypothetical protein
MRYNIVLIVWSNIAFRLIFQVVRHYGQPLIGTDIKNPYVFMLFKQNGMITLSEAWREKFTTGNVAGAWTIEDFTTAVNMSGNYSDGYFDFRQMKIRDILLYQTRKSFIL